MKIVLKKENIEPILNSFQSFLDKKDQSQIVSHIFFKASDGSFLLRATDYELGIQSQIQDSKILEEGKGTMNGKMILDIIKNLNDHQEITLETKDYTLFIKQEDTECELQMFNADEFPEFPSYSTDTKIEIPSAKFVDAIKKVNPAVGINNPRTELHGALLEIKDYTINFVATDTRRLALVNYETQSVNSFSIIIPKRALGEIQRFATDELQIFHNEKQLIIQSGQYTFFTKLINSKFVNYERILENNFIHTIELSRNEVLDCIRRVNSISTNIQMTFKNDEVLFKSVNGESYSKANTRLKVNLDLQEEFSIAFNSKSLIDFLAQLSSQTFSFCLNKPTDNITVKSENFLTVIIPIIL